MTVKDGELRAMLIFVMTMVNVIAKKILKVSSVILVPLVSPTFQLVQVCRLQRILLHIIEPVFLATKNTGLA